MKYYMSVPDDEKLMDDQDDLSEDYGLDDEEYEDFEEDEED